MIVLVFTGKPGATTSFCLQEQGPSRVIPQIFSGSALLTIHPASGTWRSIVQVEQTLLRKEVVLTTSLRILPGPGYGAGTLQAMRQNFILMIFIVDP